MAEEQIGYWLIAVAYAIILSIRIRLRLSLGRVPGPSLWPLELIFSVIFIVSGHQVLGFIVLAGAGVNIYEDWSDARMRTHTKRHV